MKEYENYINDRINGLYSILESSVVYEGYSEKNKEAAKRSFLSYLKKKDPKKAEKYKKDPKQIKKEKDKNSKAIINWILDHPTAARFIFDGRFVDNVLMANGKK